MIKLITIAIFSFLIGILEGYIFKIPYGNYVMLLIAIIALYIAIKPVKDYNENKQIQQLRKNGLKYYLTSSILAGICSLLGIYYMAADIQYVYIFIGLNLLFVILNTLITIKLASMFVFLNDN